MATTPKITVPTPPAQSAGKFIIRTVSDSIKLTAPYAPKEVTYLFNGAVYQNVPRPDLTPITTNNGFDLKKITLTLLIGSTDFEKSVASLLTILQNLADTLEPLFVDYESQTKGLWSMTSLSFSSVERQSITNEITRANADIEFTEYSNFKTVAQNITALGTSTKGTTKLPTTYKVLKTDTLKTIATKNKTTVAALQKLNPKIKNMKNLPTTIKVR